MLNNSQNDFALALKASNRDQAKFDVVAKLTYHQHNVSGYPHRLGLNYNALAFTQAVGQQKCV